MFCEKNLQLYIIHIYPKLWQCSFLVSGQCSDLQHAVERGKQSAKPQKFREETSRTWTPGLLMAWHFRSDVCHSHTTIHIILYLSQKWWGFLCIFCSNPPLNWQDSLDRTSTWKNYRDQLGHFNKNLQVQIDCLVVAYHTVCRYNILQYIIVPKLHVWIE